MVKAQVHRRTWPFILAALILAFVVLFALVQTRAAVSGSKQKGISFASWWHGDYSSPNADLALAELGDSGADWLSLIVTRYQDTVRSTAIISTANTPTDEDLAHVINRAHSLGMKVMLKPHLDLANDPSHWRGDIGAGFSQADWAAWFTSYKAFVDHYAQLAQTYGADQFCVGTELDATQSRVAEWRSVIAGVRGLFTGPITYAANHGSEISITWWDSVDFIGVDAYYPLTFRRDPSLAELKLAWLPRRAVLKTLSAYWGKPILFTEIGYRSQDGANQHPWDFQAGGTIDLQEQADLYQAALESVFSRSWFAGEYWWTWETSPAQGGPTDMGYSPHGKPAEAVLRAWYGVQARSAQSPGSD